jgi:hypothetical protein
LSRKLFFSCVFLSVLLCFYSVNSVKAVAVWNETYGGAGNDSARSLVETPDGGYAIAGWKKLSGGAFFSFNYADFWLVKTDSLGNMQWNKTYDGTSGYDDCAYSLVETPDGGYALAGGIDSLLTGGWDFWLVKTDPFGNMEWNQTYGGIGVAMDWAWSLAATSDGGYVLAGITYSFGVPGANFYLVKTDTLGNMEWNKAYGGDLYEEAFSVIATSDGGYAVAGCANSFGAGGNDFWLAKADELGVIPEFSSWLVPALVLTATAFIIINKIRLFHKTSLKP